MNIDILVLCLVLVLVIAVWNGLVIMWYITKDIKWSQLWHKVGFVIRAIIVLMSFIEGGWLWALIVAFVAWVPYNIIINKIMKQKWYYLSDSGIDGFIKKLFKIK